MDKQKGVVTKEAQLLRGVRGSLEFRHTELRCTNGDYANGDCDFYRVLPNGYRVVDPTLLKETL